MPEFSDYHLMNHVAGAPGMAAMTIFARLSDPGVSSYADERVSALLSRATSTFSLMAAARLDGVVGNRKLYSPHQMIRRVPAFRPGLRVRRELAVDMLRELSEALASAICDRRRSLGDIDEMSKAAVRFSDMVGEIHDEGLTSATAQKLRLFTASTVARLVDASEARMRPDLVGPAAVLACTRMSPPVARGALALLGDRTNDAVYAEAVQFVSKCMWIR